MTKLTSVLFHTLMLKLYTKVQRLINIQCLLLKYMDKLMKYDLIILDDFALRSIDEQTRIALYQLLDDNKENYRLSIIITSLLPT